MTNDKKGFVSLGATIILGSIIVGIALTVAVLSFILNSTNLAIKLSAEALAAAQAGVNEGFMRVLRNDVTFNQSFTPFPPGGPAAEVRICKDRTGGIITACGVNTADGKYEIISIGSAFLKKRQVVAVVQVDALTHLTTFESVVEKSF